MFFKQPKKEWTYRDKSIFIEVQLFQYPSKRLLKIGGKKVRETDSNVLIYKDTLKNREILAIINQNENGDTTCEIFINNIQVFPDIEAHLEKDLNTKNNIQFEPLNEIVEKKKNVKLKIIPNENSPNAVKTYELSANQSPFPKLDKETNGEENVQKMHKIVPNENPPNTKKNNHSLNQSPFPKLNREIKEEIKFEENVQKSRYQSNENETENPDILDKINDGLEKAIQGIFLSIFVHLPKRIYNIILNIFPKFIKIIRIIGIFSILLLITFGPIVLAIHNRNSEFTINSIKNLNLIEIFSILWLFLSILGALWGLMYINKVKGYKNNGFIKRNLLKLSNIMKRKGK